MYIYAEIKGVKKYIPIEKATNIAISRDVFKPIIVNGRCYYAQYVVNSKNGKQSILFGKSYEFDISEDKLATLHIKIAGTLSERIRDFEFLLVLNYYKAMTINGREIEFNSISLTADEIENIEKKLKKLKNIKLALDELDVQEELDISNLGDVDKRNLDTLVKAVIQKEDIVLKGADNGVVTSGFFVIANITILLIGNQNRDCIDHYSVYSFTKPSHIKFLYTNETGEFEMLGSQYLLLRKEHFSRASNLNYDVVYASLTDYGCEEVMIDRVNNSMLEILKAYDETKKASLLNLAEKLQNWIKSNRINPEYQTEIDILNQMQIVKRKRKLTSEELAELIVIKKTCKDNRYLCGVFILLGDEENAQLHFRQLDLAVQLEFIEYPICEFWNARNEIRGQISVQA